MTNHRAGKTNAKDPRGGWRAGKEAKKDTARYVRHFEETHVIEEQLEETTEDLSAYIGARARRLLDSPAGPGAVNIYV